MKRIRYKPKRLTRKEVDYIARTICNQTSALKSQRDINKVLRRSFGIQQDKHVEKAIGRFDRTIAILTQVEIIK